MSNPGDDPADLVVRARAALLDAVDALAAHRTAVIVIGAQAVYLRTGGIDVALAEATKDSDVALDPRQLADDPRIEIAMRQAGFLPSANGQPGAWVNTDGIPVDIMVPEGLAGPGGRQARGARIPPHDKKAARRARGLEAALVDHDIISVTALDPADHRSIEVNVAGPAALLVAKAHKLGERLDHPARLNDKDAHDAYRILRAIETKTLRDAFPLVWRSNISTTCSLPDRMPSVPQWLDAPKKVSVNPNRSLLQFRSLPQISSKPSEPSRHRKRGRRHSATTRGVITMSVVLFRAQRG